MILATIIRLEMAYPGVGVLAGDSLQYLSVVTAHAVIMVFFMIMPLLFGAFGNFLLPTQLGVHDVAFPRLNSAAFWFLPAGLLMLVQLVCLDRRYQRMNCYNIREIQTLLKSQYAPNSNDAGNVHFLLNETVLGLRYKLMSLTSVDSSMLNYYRNSLNASYQLNVTFSSPTLSLKSLNEGTYLTFLTSLEHVFITQFFMTMSSNSLSSTSSVNFTGFTVFPTNGLINGTAFYKNSFETLSSRDESNSTLNVMLISYLNTTFIYLVHISRLVGESVVPFLSSLRTICSA
jgi:hypothetical protein